MRLFTRILAPLILALPVVLATSSVAHADGYVGFGVGSQGKLDGSLSEHFTTGAQSDTSRFILGQRFGGLALEASLFKAELEGTGGAVGKSEFSTASIGIDIKYYVGLVGGLEGYGKIGLNKTWLRGPAAQNMNYEGRGTEVGAGLQYTLNLPLTQVGLWLDYSVQETQLRDLEMGTGSDLDGELRMLNLGVFVGF